LRNGHKVRACGALHFAVSANFGTVRGENAFGAGAAVRINEFLVANAALGTGLARGGVGGRVGATFAW
jgi:hypothetical protein